MQMGRKHPICMVTAQMASRVAIRPEPGADSSDVRARAGQNDIRDAVANDRIGRINRASATLAFEPALIPDDEGDIGHFIANEL